MARKKPGVGKPWRGPLPPARLSWLRTVDDMLSLAFVERPKQAEGSSAVMAVEDVPGPLRRG
ncbi:hypothetical protein E2562_018956 [Oryza meyeriana var. granulata]|uniref:Uncharacterized protein n=1 Tax=Oryza meyeriana var. granulata TaxID=110450 RepID=A0A6G1DIR2_9ORYZ|nr:hypothetical protein E2562_018955 [Oryza meyeriana var. granulata]KAF0912706.1 hypothetical protein E2562_018956 [Oryza meyeriana var. granulata]